MKRVFIIQIIGLIVAVIVIILAFMGSLSVARVSKENIEYPSVLDRTILSREEQIAIMKTCIEDTKACWENWARYEDITARKYSQLYAQLILGFFQYRTNPANMKGETK